MGYRLGITRNDKCIFYGTKYYGYVGNDPVEMIKYGDSLSCKYLLKLNKLKYDTYFGYSSNFYCILKKNQLIRFIELYCLDLARNGYANEDFNVHDEHSVINELLKIRDDIMKDNRKNEYYIDWS